MGAGRAPGTLRRLARSHGLVRSPLRRATHRVEAALTALAVLLALLVVPAAASVALGIYQRELAEAGAAAAQRTQVTATLVADPVLHRRDRSAGHVPPEATAVATWRLPNGRQVSQPLQVTPDQHAGQTMRIWTDREGHRTLAPKTPGDVFTAALIIGVDLVILGWLLLGALWWLACRGLEGINAMWWELQWARTGPRWSRRSWQ